jgi:hypothetical protein
VQDKDLVLIGTADSQPLLSKWAERMPLVLSGLDLRVNEGAAWTLLLHPEWPFRPHDGGRLMRLLGGGAKFDLLVESFISPLRSDRLVVAIVPSTSNAIDAVRALITPSERQGPVYGGVAVSHNGRFESFLLGTRAYRAGELDRRQYTSVLLIENYWLIPPLVLLLAVVIAAWVRWSTERVAERRLAPWESNRGVSQ